MVMAKIGAEIMHPAQGLSRLPVSPMKRIKWTLTHLTSFVPNEIGAEEVRSGVRQRAGPLSH